MILRALPVSHPEQLALLTDPDEAATNVETTEHGDRSILSYPEFVELRNHNSVFSGLFAAQSQPVSVDVTESGTGGPSTKARLQLVSGEFFDVLGVQPALGRAFTNVAAPLVAGRQNTRSAEIPWLSSRVTTFLTTVHSTLQLVC